MSHARSDSDMKEDEIGEFEPKPGLVGRIEELCQVLLESMHTEISFRSNQVCKYAKVCKFEAKPGLVGRIQGSFL